MLPGTLLARDSAATIFKSIERELGGSTAWDWQPIQLEAALAWLERNRLSDHLHLLEGDSRYAWTAARRRHWAPFPVAAGMPGRTRER